jgi:hypothetical protein
VDSNDDLKKKLKHSLKDIRKGKTNHAGDDCMMELL